MNYAELASRISDFPKLYVTAYHENYSELIDYIISKIEPTSKNYNPTEIITEDFANRLTGASLGALAWMYSFNFLSAKEMIGIAQKMDEVSHIGDSNIKVLTNELFSMMVDICNEFGSWIELSSNCITEVSAIGEPIYDIESLSEKIKHWPLGTKLQWSSFLRKTRSRTNEVINETVRETVAEIVKKYTPEKEVRYRTSSTSNMLKDLEGLSDKDKMVLGATLDTPGEALLYCQAMLKVNEEVYEEIYTQSPDMMLDVAAARLKCLINIPINLAKLRLEGKTQDEVINKLKGILPEYVKLVAIASDDAPENDLTDNEFAAAINDLIGTINRYFQ